MTAPRMTEHLSVCGSPQGGVSEWRTIDSAPKDGRKILAFGDGDIFIAWWWTPDPLVILEDADECKPSAEWVSNDYHADTMDSVGQPTHWQPLPSPPEAA